MAKTDKTWAWQQCSDKSKGQFNQGAGRDLYGNNIADDAILNRKVSYPDSLHEVDTFACCPLSERVLEYQLWYLISGLNQGITLYDMPEAMTDYSFSNRCGLIDEISMTYCPRIGVRYRD